MTSSFSIRRTGDASPAEARSAERTAKPSTLERSNGGTSIGATTSSASAQPSASASDRVSPRHRARKQRGLETRQRILARQDGQELVLIDAVAIFRQGLLGHFGTHIIPATYRHRPACPPQTLRSRRAPQARLRRGRSRPATIRPTASVIQAPCFRSSSTISAMPTLEAILRASGRLTRLARAAAREAIEHGKRQRPPCRKGLIRRARQHHDRRLCRCARRPRCGRAAGQCRGREPRRAPPMPSPPHRCGRRRSRRRSGADRTRRHRARAQSMRHRGPRR